MASTSERIYVVRSGASATASTPVALVAATAKTVISVLGSANDTIGLKRVRISFASVTAADVPATVEVGIITAAGTVGTAFTPVQTVGSSLASSCSAGYNHSGEPTYNRVFETLYCPVNNGLADWYYPLGEEPQCDPSQGFAVRVTAPQAQNCFASLWYSE
jgi:hypothetical protein